jgi:hypothetical protein
LDAVDRPRRDQDVCLVIDDLGHLGLIYCESDVETATVENVIGDLLGGQYSNPVRVIASTSPMDCRGIFRPMWPQSYGDLQLRDVPSGIQDFVERHEGKSRQLSLRLI